MCPPLAVIAGPTASGKSALALALAERIGGWVVNADSAQVYRDLHILSARPSAADEARARHLVYGYRDGAEACSAADWATDAKTAIADAHAVGATPILVGGTGLYIRTLLDGIAPVPPIDPAVRAEVRALSTPDAYALLTREDADAATRLGPSDTTRIARALEVVRSTGKALAHWQAERSDGIAGRVSLHPLLLLPPRDWLYHRCNRRFETMIETGCEEVQRLLSRGLSPDLPVMRAIGVPEMAALARGKIDAAEARERGAAATRRYAKRQYTWFRHQPPAEWPRFEAPLEGDHLGEALALLERSIAGAGRID